MPHFHIPIMFNFTLHVCTKIFHMVNIDVPAGVGGPPLNKTSCTFLNFLQTKIACTAVFVNVKISVISLRVKVLSVLRKPRTLPVG